MQRAGIIYLNVNRTFSNIVLIIFTIFIASSIKFNFKITKSKKEKYVMTPLSVITFVNSVFVIFSVTNQANNKKLCREILEGNIL